jgi:uncharacterized SAM-binding protein YcdF (DUF218 family)
MADDNLIMVASCKSDLTMRTLRQRFLGGALWFLHVLIGTAAALSVLTNRFELWVDVRRLGWGGPVLEWVWALTAIAAGWLAGPTIRGWVGGKARWVLTGVSGRWARLLLWPSGVMVAVLLANTGYYLWLYFHGRADGMVPLPAVAAGVLGIWVVMTWNWTGRMNSKEMLLTQDGPREWGQDGEAPPVTMPPSLRQKHGTRRDNPVPLSWWGRIFAAGMAGATVVLLAGAVLVHMYERPPAGKVDLAVVLGGRLNDDGTASVLLADRVRAATNLYRRGLVKHILLSGAIERKASNRPRELSELAAMRAVCLAEGVPEDAISIDPVGVNTKATAYNTREFMRAHGYATVVAVSTDFHLFRTHLSFAWAGVEAYTLASQPTEWRVADPRDTLREMVGIVVYVLHPHYREAKGALMELKMPRVVVRKTAGMLELFDGGRLVKTYPCITGRNVGDKAVEGDKRSPVGTFHIVFKNPLSQFHLSLGLDYPGREDAERGLASGLITRAQYDGILEALGSDLTRKENQDKLWYTPLGGEIFIHGHSDGRTGTAGCIALSNDDVEELYAILPLGTEVEIRP